MRPWPWFHPFLCIVSATERVCYKACPILRGFTVSLCWSIPYLAYLSIRVHNTNIVDGLFDTGRSRRQDDLIMATVTLLLSCCHVEIENLIIILKRISRRHWSTLRKSATRWEYRKCDVAYCRHVRTHILLMILFWYLFTFKQGNYNPATVLLFSFLSKEIASTVLTYAWSLTCGVLFAFDDTRSGWRTWLDNNDAMAEEFWI